MNKSLKKQLNLQKVHQLTLLNHRTATKLQLEHFAQQAQTTE